MPSTAIAGDLTKVCPQTPNTTMRIQAQALVWITIGSGTFPFIEAAKLSFNGKTDKFLWIEPQKFDINIELVDATNCKIDINGTHSSATYTQSGSKMEISIASGGETHSLKLEAGDGGTYLNADIPNVPKNRIWIGK